MEKLELSIISCQPDELNHLFLALKDQITSYIFSLRKWQIRILSQTIGEDLKDVKKQLKKHKLLMKNEESLASAFSSCKSLYDKINFHLYRPQLMKYIKFLLFALLLEIIDFNDRTIIRKKRYEINIALLEMDIKPNLVYHFLSDLLEKYEELERNPIPLFDLYKESPSIIKDLQHFGQKRKEINKLFRLFKEYLDIEDADVENMKNVLSSMEIFEVERKVAINRIDMFYWYKKIQKTSELMDELTKKLDHTLYLLSTANTILDQSNIILKNVYERHYWPSEMRYFMAHRNHLLVNFRKDADEFIELFKED
ncbi:hypothetical protein SNEBB_008114 [Seison nebaliae]|nr:hypothetical protein SNEBB_008114 [Seison nebaliae]